MLNPTTADPVVTLIEDQHAKHSYRVEAIYANGDVEVAIFAGPNAISNAANFAILIYDTYLDPQGLSK